jgi:hypothetical protein
MRKNPDSWLPDHQAAMAVRPDHCGILAGMARDHTRSPFPGMDPYLEAYWGDVHHRLCTYGSDMLQRVLPPGLISHIEERTTIEFGHGDQRPVIPDIRVDEFKSFRPSAQFFTAIIDEPLIVENELDVTEGFIQIIDVKDNHRVVTVIEFASPTNKISPTGRAKYRSKRIELLEGGVSVVEVDLIRAGEWNLMAPKYLVEARRPGIYHACLTRAWSFNKSGVYSISLQQRLPTIQVPLRQSDSDVGLDLQALVAQVYENGSYGDVLDYSKPAQPPLNEADATWARDCLNSST